MSCCFQKIPMSSRMSPSLLLFYQCQLSCTDTNMLIVPLRKPEASTSTSQSTMSSKKDNIYTRWNGDGECLIRDDYRTNHLVEKLISITNVRPKIRPRSSLRQTRLARKKRKLFSVDEFQPRISM